VEISLTILTVYVLFAENLKDLFLPKSFDIAHSIIMIMIIIIFLIEFFISYLCINNYPFSFYFWLDLVSILSMLFDIDWLFDLILLKLSEQDSTNNIKSLNNIAKAGKAARISTRAIKVLRVIRILRQIRIVKLYKEGEKAFERHFKKKKANESIIGKKLSDLTARKFVILILIIVTSLIFLDYSFYIQKENTMEYGLKIFNYFNKTEKELNMTINIYIKEHTNAYVNLLYLQIGEFIYGDLNSTLEYREKDKIIAYNDCEKLSDDPGYQLVSYFYKYL
jgi:hypothetical protein